MEKIGLVFTGGGGKGAYQIGVWRAFRKFGIDKHIAAVSGTSVGALNLVLFLQGDLRKAERIWLNISPEKILTSSQEKFTKKFEAIFPHKIDSSLIPKLMSKGYFSHDGLLEIIQKEASLELVSKSDIPFYATCVNVATFKPVHFKLNGHPTKYIESVLLASSALPGVFDSVMIDGERYLDGGFSLFGKSENIPVLPLYEEGCKTIIVVHLNKKNQINHSLYPKAKIIEIIPQQSQGGIIDGTLDFTPSGSSRRIKQGYDDTIRILKPIAEMVQIQKKMQDKLTYLKNYEQNLQQVKNVLDKFKKDRKSKDL